MPCSLKVTLLARWSTKTDGGRGFATFLLVRRSATAHKHPACRQRPFLRVLLHEKREGASGGTPFWNIDPPIRLKAPLKSRHTPTFIIDLVCFSLAVMRRLLSFCVCVCLCAWPARLCSSGMTRLTCLSSFTRTHTHAYRYIYIYWTATHRRRHLQKMIQSSSLSIYIRSFFVNLGR